MITELRLGLTTVAFCVSMAIADCAGVKPMTYQDTR